MWFLLALEVGVATKLSFCKAVFEANTTGLNLWLLFLLLLLLCYVLDYLTAYLGVPPLVIYAQEEDKHFE